MKINKPRLLLIILIIGFLTAIPALAKVGVGVGLGKIQVDEPLVPGGIYKLPTVPVLNTGDEETNYEMDVTYHHEQPELKLEKDWLTFTPQTFTLAGGGSQPVEVSLSLPLKVKPGDYFAYIEARPIATDSGGVNIGIAAATKTYLTIQPANVWQAIIHKISGFLVATAPTSYIILAILTIIALIIIFRKYFSINLAIRKKNINPKENDQKDNQTKK